MKITFRNIIAILFIVSSFSGTAQKETPFEKDFFPDKKDELKEAIKQIKIGDDFRLGFPPDYRQAAENYLKAYDFNPNSSELNYKLGLTYFQFDKHSMGKYFEKAYELKPTVSSDIKFFVGLSHHLDGDWKAAIDLYNAFISSANAPELQELKQEAIRKVMECKNGLALEGKVARVWIDNLGPTINSEYPDYAPVISTDEALMVFTARKPESEILSPGGGYFEDLYVSSRVNGNWLRAKAIGEPINVQGQHDATIGISPDGHTLFVYNDKKGGGDIYASTDLGGEWSKPERLGKNINTDYHEPDASLSFDGKRLYFTSDKPGGLGGHDIYYADWDEEKQEWGEAINMGAPLNTPYEERSIFIHPDGETMYFSSNGNKSMGGYDLFYSKLVNGVWSDPVNLGPPLNTPYDDVQLVVAGNGRFGYYSSYRAGGYGEKDIYLITFLGPEKPPMLSNEDNLIASIAEPIREKYKEPVLVNEGSNLAILTGVITDQKTRLPLKAQVVLIDNEKNAVIAEFESDAKTGKYLVSLPAGSNYGIAVKHEGYLFHSENFNLPQASGFKQYNKDVELKKVEVGQTIVLRNIFFDLDKYVLRDESVNELERLVKLMNDNPTLKIEISGHTDTRGSAEHNHELSANRAKAVVDYLVAHGIDSSRLVFAGYGEEKPLITDADINKLKTPTDKEDAHQSNRRTEFKILSL